jgi:nucleotide-binding universal stress UspA family protein
VPSLDPLRDVRSILVAVDGSEASFKALASACGIARHSKARVSLLHVIEVPRALPLDADLDAEVQRGEDVLTRAERVAHEHHVKAVGQIIQARQAGAAVVDEASEGGCDVIALGLGFEGPFGRFQVDDMAQYVLEHAPCDVWVFRYAPVAGDGVGGAGADGGRGAS